MYYFVRLTFEKLLGGLVGSFVKSPVERDFGEAHEDDIVVPDTVKYSLCSLEEIVGPMANMFAAMHGLSSEKYEKVHTRIWELPEQRSAQFQYQVRESENTPPTELQLLIQKHPNNVVMVEFRSSAAIMQLVESMVPPLESKATS